MARVIDELGQEIGLGSRTEPRQSVFFPAKISRPDGPPLGQIKVRNISRSGLMAETSLPLRVGETVELELRGIGPVRGVILRRADNRFAVKFDLPIDPSLTRTKL